MREIHAAIERFDTAIARLEAALEDRAKAPAVAPDDAAGLIDRLRRENEALRAARAREAELRGAALRRVDVAIAALEAALAGRGAETAASGRSRAMFGEAALAAEPPNRGESAPAPRPRPGRATAS